jgi:membrane peptidoglycan carboxypeptidase
MAAGSGSIAAMPATSRTASEAAMDKKTFHDEAVFQATMHIARRMLEEKLITKKEYKAFEQRMIAKYNPIFT